MNTIFLVPKGREGVSFDFIYLPSKLSPNSNLTNPFYNGPRTIDVGCDTSIYDIQRTTITNRNSIITI